MKTRAQHKILMLTHGRWEHASSRIRALEYIPLFESTGKWKIQWIPRTASINKPGIVGVLLFALAKRLFSIRRFFIIVFKQWDLLFVQRLILPSFILKIIRWRKIPLIFDFDDAIYTGSKKNLLRTRRMIKFSSKVIVSSQKLAFFCEKYKTNPLILPSPVDDIKITAKHMDLGKNTITIGWIGSVWTEKYLKEIEDPITSLSHDLNIQLLLVGASNQFKLNGVNIEITPWSYEDEAKLLHKMDIGIMPLTDDEWSKGKGGYKLYQYMAAGLPVIASPVGINTTIVDHGVNGYHAKDKCEWEKYLKLLVLNPELRKSLGDMGRQKMSDHYSYAKCFPILHSTFEEVINLP